MSALSEYLSDEHTYALQAATGRQTAIAALAWIAEGHPLAGGTSLRRLMAAALVAEGNGVAHAEGAVAVLTRLLARSTLDPATMLFEPESMPEAAQLRDALNALASKCRSGSLADITATAVRNAQHANSGVMEVLCLVAGVTFEELRDRLSPVGLPSDVRGTWTTAQLNAAFAEIDSIVSGTTVSNIADAVPARPIELILGVVGGSVDRGWSRIEELRIGGVPYEILLAQRVVGSAWGQHRNRTSRLPTRAVALDLRERIKARGFDVVLVTGYGGDAKQRDVNELVGGSGDVALVVRTAGDYRAFYAVTFGLAKDGGSARKTAGTKIKMDRPSVPVAVVALGGGWAERNETTDLVRAFEGAVFTELTLDDLVDQIASSVPQPI